MVQVAAYDSRYGVFALRYWEKCVKLYFLLILLCCSIQPHHLLKSCWQIESMRRGGIDLEDGTKTGGGVLIILAGETGRRDYLTFGDIIKRAVSWIIERRERENVLFSPRLRRVLQCCTIRTVSPSICTTPHSTGNMKISIKRRLFPKCLEVVLFIEVLDLLSKPKRQKPDIYFYQLILHRTLLIFPHCFWCKSFIKFCITNGLAPSLDGNSDFLRWYKEEGWLVDYSLSFIVYLHWVVYLLG